MGKGGFWRINLEYNDMIENGIFKKRRNSREIFCFFLIKKIKREEEDDFFSCLKVGKKEGFVYFGNYED